MIKFACSLDILAPPTRKPFNPLRSIKSPAYKPCGFLIYTIQDDCFIVNDIEINKEHRINPVLLRGLFSNAFLLEKGKWSRLKGYINHKNTVSKKNFLRLATEFIETERGITFTTTKEEIKNRFFIKPGSI